MKDPENNVIGAGSFVVCADACWGTEHCQQLREDVFRFLQRVAWQSVKHLPLHHDFSVNQIYMVDFDDPVQIFTSSQLREIRALAFSLFLEVRTPSALQISGFPCGQGILPVLSVASNGNQ